MAVSVQAFKNAFSEFRKADDAEVQAKIDFAASRVTGSIWGVKADQGVMYLTAHLLALAPAGRNARLKPENSAVTVYLTEYNRLKKQVAFGFRLAGVPPADAFEDPVNG